MSIKVDQTINKTQNQEHALACLKCVGKTSHKVLVSADIRGDESYPYGSFQWSEDHQIVQCLGCKEVSFRTEFSNSEDYYQVGANDYVNPINEKLYPSRIEGRKSIGDEIHYLPPKVRNIYQETVLALSSQSPILTGIGIRALLETISKEKNAAGKDLFHKIDDLVVKGVLTPARANILHKIRAVGNAAAHEVKPHSDKQLGLAMDIIEHLLKDVYILPKQAEDEFGSDETEEK